jgi:adenylate cyclase
MSGEELPSTEAVAASPIFNHRDEVVGAVYGVRSQGLKNQRVGVRHLEAQLVQLLAETMTVGLERQRREAEAARTRILLEQAFSPELASQLQRNPQMLEGHEREITVLFSDLRGFFEISERLGPHETYRFLGDVMNRLTESIMSASGVIIDYYGDGLAAMWNAPTDQYNHAELACRAAHAMLEELPAINAAWRESLGQDLDLGIGIHTGLARVGNAGTQRRIKYGPRGATVNLASRVEGATKRLGVSLLITEQTRRLLSPSIFTRRCLRAQLSGAAEPVDLYEVPRGPLSPEQIARMRGYEEALALFESGDLATASEHLVAMMQTESDEDAALRFLREYIEGLRLEATTTPAAARRKVPAVVVLPK